MADWEHYAVWFFFRPFFDAQGPDAHKPDAHKGHHYIWHNPPTTPIPTLRDTLR